MYAQDMNGGAAGPAAPGMNNAGNQDAAYSGFPINGAGMMYMMDTGRQYAEGIIGRLINIRELRKYFAVSTDYVLNKLKLILFPYTYHGSWQRSVLQIKGERGEMYPPPRADINAPDLYIPVMGFVTYIVFCAMVSGFSGGFKPELLGIVGTKALVFFGLDVAVLRLGYYLLSNTPQSLLDCVSLCGYVFVGVALNELGQMIGGKWVLYPVLAFTFAGMAVFLTRTVRVVLLSDPAPAQADAYGGPVGYSEPSYGMGMGMTDATGAGSDPTLREQKNRRYFLLLLAFMQLVVMYFLAFSPALMSQQSNQQQQQQQQQMYGNTQNDGNNNQRTMQQPGNM